MRQPRSRPCGRNVCHEIVLGPLARLYGDQRRAGIAIAEFGADHFRRLVLLDVGDARELLAQRRASGRRLANFRPIECAPPPPPLRRKARRRHVARSHLPALDLVGGEQIGPAPSRERRRKLPRQIDGVTDAGIHPEPARRNDEMHSVPGEENPALAVAVGEQQIHPPLPDVEHLVFDRHGDDPREHARHVRVGLDDGMQGEMPGRILDDQETPLGVGHVIMPALADGDAFVEVFAIIERLPQLLQVGLAAELNAELTPHQAAAAVAADHIGGAQRGQSAVASLNLRRDRALILLERHELAPVAHRDARQRLRDRFQQRLERVLRDELIGLERLVAVLGFFDLRPCLRHGRMHVVHQGRLRQRQHDEDVHRAMRRQPGGANLLHDAHAPIDLHGARVAALHLR